MPSVLRRVARSADPAEIAGYSRLGTQYLENGAVLSFTGAHTLVPKASFYGEGGNFVVFDYNAGDFPGGQAELGNVTLDLSNLPNVLLGVLRNVPEFNIVVLYLTGKGEKSIQYVDGNLNFAGAHNMFLNASLFSAPGTYTLYSVTGTVSNLNNLYVFPLKAGLIADRPFTVGSNPTLVKVTLRN